MEKENKKVSRGYLMVKPWYAENEEVIDMVKTRALEEGLSIVKARFVKYDELSAREHYIEHVGKPFFPKVITYITSGKVYGMIVEGKDAIKKIRKICGSTKDPEKGTLRYDVPKKLGIEIRVTENVVHASDSEEAAEREIAIFESLPEYVSEPVNE